MKELWYKKLGHVGNNVMSYLPKIVQKSLEKQRFTKYQ